MTVSSSPGATDLSLDEALELLQSNRRRYLLLALSEWTTPASLPRIADKITELEYGDPPEERRSERHQIYMALYHAHVPKLEDAGVVSYSQADDSVEWGENGPEILRYLDGLPTSDPTPSGASRGQTTDER